MHLFTVSRRVNDVQQVIVNRPVHRNRAHGPLHRGHLFASHHRLQLIHRLPPAMALQHLSLAGAVRIPHGNAHQEAIQLALRKHVRSFELKWILSGDDHERGGQAVRGSVGRHLPITHRLQQGALRSRRRSVDFIGQDNIRENRAAIENKLGGIRIKDAAAHNIAGQQVGRELNPTEDAVQAASQGLADQRLADSRHVLQQDMLASHQSDQAQTHHLRLAHNDALQVVLQGMQ